MNTQSTQQYHEFIRGFFILFDEIKKEDDPIYNSRVGFNAVKFLINHSIWNLETDEDKNKAYEVILPEQNKMKKAEQKLESEVKARLKEYVDDIAGVSIYGDHTSITLRDNKKEFKISEFLNSDFYRKKGISGFSTLHSNGKSGMHGFVAEEGEKRIRHYVVTDGSYEMTLNWHDKNGKKCTIKINIDKDGVDLTERNGVTEEQLKANTDIKIGGLFLYQIQFKEKGQEQENQQSSETFMESDISKGVGVQATQDQEVEFKHATTSTTNSNNASAKKIPPSLPPRASSLPNNQKKDEYQPIRINSGNNDNSPYSDASSSSTIFTKSVIYNQDNTQEDKRYDNPMNQQSSETFMESDISKGVGVQATQDQEVEFKHATTSTTNSNNASAKKIPPSLPPRASSLPNNQKKDEYQPIRINSGNNDNSPYSDASSSSTIFTKSVIYNQDNTQEDKRYDNPMNQQSSETFMESDISKGVGVQATQDQEVEFKHATTSTTNSNNASAKKIPPSLPPRASSLPNNQKKDEYQPIRINSGNNDNSPYSDASSSSTIFTKSVIYNQDNTQEDKRYDNPMNQQSSETFMESDISKGVGVQATQDQEVEFKHATTSTTNSNNASAKKIPPSLPPRASSLPNNQKKDEYQPIRINSGNNDNSPYSDASSSSTIFTKSVIYNQDNTQEDKRYDNPTFGHSVPGSRKSDESEQISNNRQEGAIFDPTATESAATAQDVALKKVKESRNTGNKQPLNEDEYITLSNPQSDYKQEKDYLSTKENEERGNDKQKETEDKLQENESLEYSSTDIKTNDSGYSSPTHSNHEKSQVNSGQLKASLMNVEQRDDTLLTEFTSKLDKETQKFLLKPVNQKKMSGQTKEHLLAAGLLKDNSAEKEINDSGYSSPTYTSLYNFQVNSEQLEKRLETIEPKDTLEKLNKGLREPSHQATKDLFSESMLKEIKEGKEYNPVRKLLERKVAEQEAEQENDNTNLTIDKNSELYKLLEKDAEQLKAGIVEEERKDTLTERDDSTDRNRIALANRNRIWAKLIAEEKQKKDSGISIG
ncbi:hypothetical protein [Wolbachia endosymbiont of Trichogramma kaykai]|uniref:hypothetical protein n=1 Tax=Wolbachia endosymbiont of Trichogramma kaykai TaxID=444066 RepID=UPI00389233F1